MNSAKKNLSILIVAGGTGGHLFPARLIAQAFLKRNSETQLAFVGTGRPLEEKIIDQAGFKRHVVTSAGINGRGLKGIVEFLFSLPRSILQSLRIISSLKPDAVIGVGGYVTGIPLLLAALKGIPTLIHEAEIHPGMANRFLGRFVDRISVAFQQATIGPKDKVFYSGQPLRADMQSFLSDIPHLPSEVKKILIVGGSLGAKTLDTGLIEIAHSLAHRGVEIWHQTRPESLSQVTQAYQAVNLSAKVVPFIDDMTKAYAWADIIVARAGASTIMEITVLNRPAIFVPLPAPGDHQLLNARVLEDQGKALIVEQGERFSERLLAAIDVYRELEFYRATVERPALGRNVDGAERIVDAVIGLIGA